MSDDPVVALCNLVTEGDGVYATDTEALLARALLVAWDGMECDVEDDVVYGQPVKMHDATHCRRCRILALVEGRDA